MNAAITNVGICGIEADHKGEAVSEGMRLVISSWFNELPVALFGMITLAYLASSLLTLVR
ncbi:MAG TPA: hypothetical protein VMT58_06185 [Candidatus Binataceae bacterium]|nr:hypothetical protein [Candidatus Binataceae bacterium]